LVQGLHSRIHPSYSRKILFQHLLQQPLIISQIDTMELSSFVDILILKETDTEGYVII
jgi:hypothetical protein